MKWIRRVLAGGGVLAVIAALTNIHRMQLSTDGVFQVLAFNEPRSRVATGALGCVLIFIAVRGGIALWSFITIWFIAAIVTIMCRATWIALNTDADAFMRIWAPVSQTILAGIICVMFFKWWWPKRPWHAQPSISANKH